jgi:hypothetical protein
MQENRMDTHTRVIPIPLQSRSDRRGGDRLDAAMPLLVDGYERTTQNVSTEGIAFESEDYCAVGTRLDVVIQYLLDGAQYPLSCEAEVVRVEPQQGRWLVAARLLLDPNAGTATDHGTEARTGTA